MSIRTAVILATGFAAFVALASCAAPDPAPPVEPPAVSEPAPAPAPTPDPPPKPIEPPPAVAPFDPATVSVELKQTTFVDVKALIARLNAIIQAKDYEGWSKVLTAEYLDYYSSPETLAKISESAVLKRQGVTLKTIEDYFRYVVYPSRQNDRVDDIEFIEPSRIRAIIVNAKGERLVLYNLEKIGDTWKIAIWR